MRIITWNCLGIGPGNAHGFQDKKDDILKLKPDILVVQECEPLDKLTFPEGFQPTEQDRIGEEGQQRGLAVFSFNGFGLERLCCHNPDIKFFLPLRVFKDDLSLTILATWIWHLSTEPVCKYLDDFNAAVDHYILKNNLGQEKMLFLGDFNTPGTGCKLPVPQAGNQFLERHLEIVAALSQKGIKSLFHEKNKIEHGREKEEDATLYHGNDLQKPFHCDYCFASQDLMQHLQSVEIGKPESWLKLSDHMPLILDFDL